MTRRWVWACLWLVLLPSVATAEEIRRFDVTVELAGDDTFVVTETIAYDFGSARRRGIFRDIPVAYGRGRSADYHIAFDLESVTDAAGNPQRAETPPRQPGNKRGTSATAVLQAGYGAAPVPSHRWQLRSVRSPTRLR